MKTIFFILAIIFAGVVAHIYNRGYWGDTTTVFICAFMCIYYPLTEGKEFLKVLFK